MKPFIDSNTQKRAQAKHEFEKAYVTLMKYSVFGKCKENFQKKNVKLTTKKQIAVKCFSQKHIQGRSLY